VILGAVMSFLYWRRPGQVPTVTVIAQPTTQSAAPVSSIDRDRARRSEIVSPGSHPLREAALRVPLAEVPPPRELDEAVDPTRPIRVLTGFEGSEPSAVSQLSPSQFTIDMAGSSGNWFLFKIEGARDRTVRVDLIHAEHAGNWSTLRPVYACAASLGEPALFDADGNSISALAETTEPASAPASIGGKWSSIAGSWQDGKTFSISQRFEGDIAYVAMKYPLTPTLQQRLLDVYAANPKARVVEAAKSKGGRPIRVVIIGDDSTADLTKPCVLIYGREHANEQDPGWVVDGATRFLLSDAPEASVIRQRCTFLLLPLLDVDGAAAGTCENMTNSFRDNSKSPESESLAAFFTKWANDGHRLDVAFNLHNVESREGRSHFFPHLFDPNREQLGLSVALHRTIMQTFEKQGFIVRPDPSFKGVMTRRLGGYLAQIYGTLHLVYECNSQSPARALTIAQLRQMGELLVKATDSHLAKERGRSLLASTESRLAERNRSWKRYYGMIKPSMLEGRSALDMEAFMKDLPGFERYSRQQAAGRYVPDWLVAVDKADAAATQATQPSTQQGD
jgi:hypothetical protein